MRLTDRASLLRALFRLVDTDAGDGSLTEHDDEYLEGIYLHLQQGADDAQEFMMGAGLTWWNTFSPRLEFTLDTDQNRRWTAVPEDFRRFLGQDDSAMRTQFGGAWGVEITPDLKYQVGRNVYYLEGNRVWLGRDATGYGDLRMQYIRRVKDLVDGEEVDFPPEDRTLIVGYAALHASHEHWYVGGQEGKISIDRNLQQKKRIAFKRARQTAAARKVQTPVVDSRWSLVQ